MTCENDEKKECTTQILQVVTYYNTLTHFYPDGSLNKNTKEIIVRYRVCINTVESAYINIAGPPINVDLA